MLHLSKSITKYITKSITCFKKHQDILVEQRSRREKSTLFFYLHSASNRFHVINQFRENVSLHPIDCPYEASKQYSKNGKDFVSSGLESRDLEKRGNAAETVRRFFKDAVEVSNSNIVRNANNLLMDLPRDDDKNITWVGTTKKRVDSKKFKLSY